MTDPPPDPEAFVTESVNLDAAQNELNSLGLHL